MLLKSAGIDHPMLVAFAGLACGICVLEDHHASIFCLLMLALLFSLARLPHMAAGLLVGLIAVALTPKTIWLEGEHMLSGRVAISGFEKGVFRIELDNVHLDGRKYRGLARINVYQSNQSERNTATGLDSLDGRTISARIILKPPRALGNRGEFDYARQLRSQGITMSGYIKDWGIVHIGPVAPGLNIHLRGLTDRSSALLTGFARPEAEVLKAMLWGDRSYLTYADQDRFAALGLSHLIAISGLNIGLIMLFGYMLTFTFVRLIPPLAEIVDTPELAKLSGLICVLLFAGMVEPSYPTTRSVIMALIMVTTLIFVRRTDPIDALSLAGCIILCIWPLGLFTAGFLLSFAAVFGLIVALDRLKNAGIIIQSIAVPVTAAAFTLPIAVYVFGFVAPGSIPFNVLFVPLFSFLVIPLGLLGLAVSMISTTAAATLFAWTMDIIHLILWTGEHYGHLVPVARPPIAWVYLCYVGLFLAFLAQHGKREGERPPGAAYLDMHRVILGCICLGLLCVPVLNYHYQRSRPLMFDFISVGQGDSILITKDSRAVLIDAGGSRTGFDTGRFVVGPHLLRRGITRLDLAVITHSHPDHAGGMPYILERFDVGQVWTNVVHDPGFDDVTRISALKSIPVRAVRSGDGLQINDMKIEVLHPQMQHLEAHKLDLNLHSVVLRIGDASMAGLFMADAHRFGELSLAHGDRDLKADVLKVAHHGSNGSCQDIFLEAVRPRIAIISCGYGNPYGMPNIEVLDRLHTGGIKLYGTDGGGEVQINVKRGSLLIKSGMQSAER